VETAFALLLVDWEVKSFLVSIHPDLLESVSMDREGRIEENDCYFFVSSLFLVRELADHIPV
jgi:hypothetical protein